MKYIPFLLLLFNFSFAQITLTKNDFASPGDTVRMSLTNQTSSDYFSTGTLFTWDFSSLTANSQILREFTSIGFSPVQFTFGFFVGIEYLPASTKGEAIHEVMTPMEKRSFTEKCTSGPYR